MNVTLKLDDSLCKEARHQAMNRGLSLSGWITQILKKELANPEQDQKGLLDSLAIEEGGENDFEIPRDSSEARETNFS